MEVDRFASPLNAKLQRFNSWLSTVGAEATNAFSQTWGPEGNFICTSFNLIRKVISKIKEDRAGGVIVVPHWEGAVW